jgi:hypothetical protein
MWTWTLTWGVVRDDLVVGSCPMTVDDIDRIRAETGATALLSVQCDDCRSAFAIDFEEHARHALRSGLVLANAPMRDFDPGDQRLRLPDAVVWLARLIAAGHRVYVYCTAGINRSPLTLLGYLTFVEGLGTDEAIALIEAARPEAEPYWEAYYASRSDLVDRFHDAVELRAWDLAQRQPEQSPEHNWYQAEREIIREVLLAAAANPDARLDPNRS